MTLFADTLIECGLYDLRSTNSQYTWSNNRLDDLFTKEKLYRAVASTAWCDTFGNGDIQVLSPITFDHCPLLHIVDTSHHFHSFPHGLHRYEASWNTYANFAKIVAYSWMEVDPSHGDLPSLSKKLECCMRSFKRWSKNQTPLSDHKLQSKIHRLDTIQSNLQATTVEEASQLKKEISAMQHSLHLKWKQRAKIHWLQKGD
ncbi:hypothetical protein F2P56_027290 [Juglans regia]|uniref:Uncharacterized protein LOC108994733 n=2 Tax=Juglans regia TaxID=51240 RepID=A0A2I4F1T2_JUGRE|nr:uncharacterized protein LOC108994733 [Juglans regia]KAF5452271.1 hypothetical protein F2P56_027290 [Juglans regia]